MLDTKLFGILISALRKDKEMTQAEMADALRISYQAVSSWERGETMPDITKLPEIAALLDVSINDLFSVSEEPTRGERILRDIKPEAPAQNPEPPAIEKEKEKESGSVSGSFTVRQALDMLPFVDRDTGGEIVRRLIRDHGHAVNLDECLPFISRDVAGELVARKLDEGASAESLLNTMPFIRKDAADKIILKLMESGSDISLLDVMPYVSRSVADEIVRDKLNKGESINASEVMPFLSRQMAGELAMRWLDGAKKNP